MPRQGVALRRHEAQIASAIVVLIAVNVVDVPLALWALHEGVRHKPVYRYLYLDVLGLIEARDHVAVSPAPQREALGRPSAPHPTEVTNLICVN